MPLRSPSARPRFAIGRRAYGGAGVTLICPTDVVDAPIEVVWGLLTDPAGWGGFFAFRIRARLPPPESQRRVHANRRERPPSGREGRAAAGRCRQRRYAPGARQGG